MWSSMLGLPDTILRQSVAEARLGEVETRRATQAFHRASGHGQMTKQVFVHSVVRELLPNFPMPLAERLFGCINVDLSGMLKYKEFISTVCVLKVGTPREQLKLVFRVLDSTESGYITRKDVRTMLSWVMASTPDSFDATDGGGMPWTAATFESTLAYLDCVASDSRDQHADDAPTLRDWMMHLTFAAHASMLEGLRCLFDLFVDVTNSTSPPSPTSSVVSDLAELVYHLVPAPTFVLNRPFWQSHIAPPPLPHDVAQWTDQLVVDSDKAHVTFADFCGWLSGQQPALLHALHECCDMVHVRLLGDKVKPETAVQVVLGLLQVYDSATNAGVPGQEWYRTSAAMWQPFLDFDDNHELEAKLRLTAPDHDGATITQLDHVFVNRATFDALCLVMLSGRTPQQYAPVLVRMATGGPFAAPFTSSAPFYRPAGADKWLPWPVEQSTGAAPTLAELAPDVTLVEMTWQNDLHAANDGAVAPPPTPPSDVVDGATLGPTPAAVGLSNLGNSCFMNAVLQCLFHTMPLQEYFVSDEYLYDLNVWNKYGMQGVFAAVYGELARVMSSNRSRPIAPLTFKLAIGKLYPQFQGHLQHDAHECLSVLLQGLSEDLSRPLRAPSLSPSALKSTIQTVKPYVDLPDSNGRPDADVAFEWWRAHVLRDPSIVTALFTGQFKSALDCSACGQTSNRFEPFSFLQVPLPPSLQRWRTVYVHVGHGRPIQKRKVRLDSRATTADLVAALRHQDKELPDASSSDPVQIVAILHGHKIHTIVQPKQLLVDIAQDLHVYSYQGNYPETVDMYCSKCTTSLPHTKRLALWSTPPILVVQLKRFQTISETQSMVKAETSIRFPTTLSLARFLATTSNGTPHDISTAPRDNVVATTYGDPDDATTHDGGNNDHVLPIPTTFVWKNDISVTFPYPTATAAPHHQDYNLYGIVCHVGVLGAGHYIAYVHEAGTWWCVDDMTVTAVADLNLSKLMCAAYLLFYERKDMESVAMDKWFKRAETAHGSGIQMLFKNTEKGASAGPPVMTLPTKPTHAHPPSKLFPPVSQSTDDDDATARQLAAMEAEDDADHKELMQLYEVREVSLTYANDLDILLHRLDAYSSTITDENNESDH
ncbi:hypothetical protein DYB32_006654 [Aphanomyces invadans]|uniref:USP domain-containing protein n=1 Tax=Aphanomyces invadans TaxID=157072 RepID=A0A418AZG5_9STRA|nr:hypothetical protein DYB32_006654 [Aphanomyces invadans]